MMGFSAQTGVGVEDWWFYLLGAIAASFWVYSNWRSMEDFKQKRRLQKTTPKRFDARRPQSMEHFYQKYFSQLALPQTVISELLQEMAEAFEVPPEYILPGDRFLDNFEDAPHWGFSGSGMARLMEAIERRERKHRNKIDMSNVETVEDYILTLGKLETGDNIYRSLGATFNSSIG